MKEIKRIEVKAGVLAVLQAAYEDYRAKQDLLNSVFELHKFDEEDAVIRSVPFLSYEKAFSKAKYLYDAAMKEIQETYIPEEYRRENLRFEVDFDSSCIKILEL